MSATSAPPVGRSTTTEVDLDALAAGYSHRRPTAEVLDRAIAMAAEAKLERGEWTLDVGGGYGEHAAQWVPLGVRPIVVDPSSAMRDHAARRPGLHVIGGIGEQLPLIDGCVGLVYAHLSIHYCDAIPALDESLRVLRPGGSLAIGTLGPRHHQRSFLSRWFPSIAPRDTDRFPNPAGLAAHLVARGATDVRIEEIDFPKMRSAGEWRAAVSARFVSSLQFLPAGELADGLVAFDRAHPDRDERLSYVIRYDWVRARR